MCDLKPGDEVIAVDDDGGILGQLYDIWLGVFLPKAPPCSLTDGGAYVVRGLTPHPDIEGLFGVEVDDEGFYPHFMFRKVQRRDWSVWLAAENTIENPNPVRAPAKEPA